MVHGLKVKAVDWVIMMNLVLKIIFMNHKISCMNVSSKKSIDNMMIIKKKNQSSNDFQKIVNTQEHPSIYNINSTAIIIQKELI